MIRWSKATRARGVVKALGLVAIAVGLPLTVESLSPDAPAPRVIGLAEASEAVSVNESVLLSGAVPLFLDRGRLQNPGPAPQKPSDQVARFEVEDAAFRILLPGQPPELPRSNAEKAPPPLAAQLAALNFGTLTIRRSRFDFVWADGTLATVHDASLAVTMGRKGAFQAKGEGQLLGQTVRLDASGTLPVPDAKSSAQKRQTIPLKFSLRANHLEANFEGRLQVGDVMRLSGEADFRSRRLRALARWLGLSVPSSTDLRDATIVGAFDWNEGRMSFSKAKVSVDGNNGEGALTLRLGGQRPAIDGTLNFKTFDLTPHIAAQLNKPAPADATRQDAGPTSGGSLVTALDADLRLSAERVLAPPLEAGRGALTLSLKSGRMLADLAELELEGGAASGQIVLETAGEQPRLAIKGKAARFDAGRIFTDALKRNPLMGRVNLVIDGSGVGPTLPDMLASFSGKGSFSVLEGARLGLDLKALAYAARQSKHVGWSAAGKGGTPLDRLEFKYLMSRGVVSVDALSAHAPTVGVISGQGKIDIPGRLLDLNVGLGRNTNEIPSADQAAAGDVLVLRGAWGDPAIGILGKPFTSTTPTVKGAAADAPALPGAK